MTNVILHCNYIHYKGKTQKHTIIVNKLQRGDRDDRKG